MAACRPPRTRRRTASRSGPRTTGSTGWPAASSPTTRGAGYLQRSALTLKGLTYSPTGAIAAAGSTSLPETPGGERNYDYRFTWIRDATFALWGLYSLGFDWEAVDFFSFIADIASRDDHLQIMYGIGGETELEEYELDHLPGYANSRPVRIGNAAYSQNQHDVWGALLDSVYLHFKAADHVDGRIWPILDKQVNEALKYWREPDAGIWEVRGQLQHFTSSKIMCWVAVDRGAKIARISGEDGKANEWELAAQEIKDDILANGVDERGVLTQYYGTKALDASLLLAPLVRFLPADDPVIRATVLAIADELTVDGLVLRYKVEETDDGFAGEEGSFTICSFWLVSALCEIGEYDRARKLCAKLLSFAGPLDLYGEEIDPHTGQHLGNFPQAFTHLALINAVLHVIKLEGRQHGHDSGRLGRVGGKRASPSSTAGMTAARLGARRTPTSPSCGRRRRSAGAASSGSRPPRSSSRPATHERRWCWSASSRATPRTGRGSRSSDRRARCCRRRSPRRGSAWPTSTSPTRSSTSGSPSGASGGSTPRRRCPTSRRAGPGWRRRSTVVDPKLIVCLGATAAKALLGSGFRVTQQRGQVLELRDRRSACAGCWPRSIRLRCCGPRRGRPRRRVRGSGRRSEGGGGGGRLSGPANESHAFASSVVSRVRPTGGGDPECSTRSATCRCTRWSPMPQ